MWRDIGLDEWLFDFDNEDDVRRLPATVLSIAQHSDAARAKAEKARQFVQSRQQQAMMVLRKQVTA